MGLKAEFSADSATPAHINLGVKRQAVAVIPQIDASDNAARTAAPAGATVPNELTSFYTRYEANIGLNDPIYVKHFLATGSAAVQLMADDNALRRLREGLEGTQAQTQGRQP